MKMQDYIHAADRIEIAAHCREEILNMTADTAMKTKKPAIRMVTGFAVAAAVIALNGALIFTLYSAKNNLDFLPARPAIPKAMTDTEYERFAVDMDTIGLTPVKDSGAELPDLSAIGLNRGNFVRMEEPYEIGLNENFEWLYKEDPPVNTYLQYRDPDGHIILTDTDHLIQAFITYGQENSFLDPDNPSFDSPDTSPGPAANVLRIEKLHQKAEALLPVLVPDYERYTFMGESKEVNSFEMSQDEIWYYPFIYNMEHPVTKQYSEHVYLVLNADGTLRQLLAFRTDNNMPDSIDPADYDAAAEQLAVWRTQDTAQQECAPAGKFIYRGGHLIRRYQFPGENANDSAVGIYISPDYTLPDRAPTTNLLEAPVTQEYRFGKVTLYSASIHRDEIHIRYSFEPADWLKEKITGSYDNFHHLCQIGARIFGQDGSRNASAVWEAGDCEPDAAQADGVLKIYSFYSPDKKICLPDDSLIRFYVSAVDVNCDRPDSFLLSNMEREQYEFHFSEAMRQNGETEFDPLCEIRT